MCDRRLMILQRHPKTAIALVNDAFNAKIAKLLPDVFTTLYNFTTRLARRLRHSLRLQRISKHKRELECDATVSIAGLVKN